MPMSVRLAPPIVTETLTAGTLLDPTHVNANMDFWETGAFVQV